MIPKTMKAPGDYREGIWLGRVLQVKVTNACDLDCKNCSVGVGIARKAKKIFRMTKDQYRDSLRSLRGFPGVIGMFGGNPCIHPDFEDLCAIFREEVPNQVQRGLWSNRLFGHGETCRATFGPYNNLNVHGSQDAWDEIKRDWPEAVPLVAGLTSASKHGPIFGSMRDIGVSEDEMWERIGKCYVNQKWSAEITVVDGNPLGYFCEIAATMAELSGDSLYGNRLSPMWWNKPMDDFASQVQEYCTKCLIPMNGKKIDAAGDELEQITKIWRPVMMTVKGREFHETSSREEISGTEEPATKYLPKGVMPYGS